MSVPLDVAATILGDRAQRGVSMASLTTYRLGGPAGLLMCANHEADLALARDAVVKTGIPVLIIGRGSNLLVADRGFAGLVITLGGMFTDIEFDDNWVRAGAAVSLPVLARKTAAAGLSGLEWAIGVPGSVGGALRMNAGGHGSQTVERLRRYRFIDLRGGEDGTFTADYLGFRYRRSNLEPHQAVVWAEFELARGNAEKSQAEIADIVRWRREHQPGGHNAGSVFTNPVGDTAGRIIDSAGLSGLRIGSAFVSPKHANFFQSDDGGSAADVLALVYEVRERVKAKAGVMLEPEIQLIGFTEEELAGLK